jgi:signal transduction histidine kinase
MKQEQWLYKIVSAAIITILLFTGFVMFTSRYAVHAELPVLANADGQLSRLVFLRTFYISFFLYSAALFGCVFYAGFMRRLCLVAGLAAAVLCVYIFDDLFTINIFMYLAYISMASLMFPFPQNGVLSMTALSLFLLFMLHPSFMGLSLGGSQFVKPAFPEICVIMIILLLAASTLSLLRFFMDKYRHNQKTIEHLNFVSTKLLLFNHRLQELAKQRGEEAVKQDRLRFTRDLHDSCGYAFSNIILVSDAAVSQGEMETAHSQEVFCQIRNLAFRGLNETRETLRLIRKLQEPYHKSIETIYQLKTIFEEVTGIAVTIEWGNMKSDYGPAINQVLTRIIQEAFTNSIRHGKASRILMQFWEFPGEFTMTVTDNGIGAVNIVKGIGLAGMEERLESVGGTLAVSLPPEGGFRLRIVIPLAHPCGGRKSAGFSSLS